MKRVYFLFIYYICSLMIHCHVEMVFADDNQTCFVFVQHQKNGDLNFQLVELNDSLVSLAERKTFKWNTLFSLTESQQYWLQWQINCSLWLDAVDSVSISLFLQFTEQDEEKFLLSQQKFQHPSCEDSSSEILVQTLVHLLRRISSNNIVVIHEDNQQQNSLVKTFHQQILNSTDRRFFMKTVGIDVMNIDRSLHTLFSDVIEMQGAPVFLVLCSLELTTIILDKTKDIGLTAFDATWITRKGNLPKHSPYHISYKVLGYRSQFLLEEEPCRLSEILGNKVATKLQHNQPVSEISILTNDEWVQIFEGNWQIDNNAEHSFSLQQTSATIGIGNILKDKMPLRVVSIADGPFLYTREKYYFQDGVCNENSMVCKVPIRNGTQTERWTYSCCFGYSVDLLLGISNILSSEIELYLVEDRKYGGFNFNTKSFNGMIGDVIAGKADIAIAGLTINSQRSKYVDFTTPFMRTEIGILTLRKLKVNNNYLNLDFISNLADETKYAIVALYTFAIIILCGIDNAALYFKDQFDKKYRNRRHKLYPFEESFSYMSGLSFQRDLGGVNPRSYGGRVTAVFFAFGMVAVSTVYTASLTANQVVQSTSDGFAGLKDPRFLNPTSAFTFATNKDTSIEDFFRSAPNEHYNRMYRFMLNYNVDSVKRGFEKVLSGELQAYLNEYPFLNHQIPKAGKCLVSLHSNTVGESGYGMAVAKGSKLKTRLSEAVLLLQENKELIRFGKKWLSDACENIELDESEKFSLTFFATPFLCIAISIVLCGFGLILETYLYRYLEARKVPSDVDDIQNQHSTHHIWRFEDIREAYTV